MPSAASSCKAPASTPIAPAPQAVGLVGVDPPVPEIADQDVVAEVAEVRLADPNFKKRLTEIRADILKRATGAAPARN